MSKIKVNILYFGEHNSSFTADLAKLQEARVQMHRVLTLSQWEAKDTDLIPDLIVVGKDIKDQKEIAGICNYAKLRRSPTIPIVLFLDIMTLAKLPIWILELTFDLFLHYPRILELEEVISKCLEHEGTRINWANYFRLLLDKFEDPVLVVHKSGRQLTASPSYLQYRDSLDIEQKKELDHFITYHLKDDLDRTVYHEHLNGFDRITQTPIAGLREYSLFIFRKAQKGNRRKLAGGDNAAIVFKKRFHISPREEEVLMLICQGKSSEEIADELFISNRTVDKHRRNILLKTRSRNMTEVVALRLSNGDN